MHALSPAQAKIIDLLKRDWSVYWDRRGEGGGYNVAASKGGSIMNVSYKTLLALESRGLIIDTKPGSWMSVYELVNNDSGQ